MAQRRMFSDKIVDTDAFLDMGVGSQNLYFHLGMRADDDGFVSNPKKVMRMIGAQEDDYKVLIAKKFVIPFESGVCVIKHWLIHNLIRGDRYTETQYIKEKNQLIIDEKTKKYSLNIRMATNGIPNDNQLAPQVRLGKIRLGEDREDNTSEPSSQVKKSKYNPLGEQVIKAFEKVDSKNKTYYGNTTQRKACDFLLEEYGLEEILKRITILSQTNKIPYFPTINTPHDLKEKWVKLQDAVDKKRMESKTLQDKKGVCL